MKMANVVNTLLLLNLRILGGWCEQLLFLQSVYASIDEAIELCGFYGMAPVTIENATEHQRVKDFINCTSNGTIEVDIRTGLQFDHILDTFFWMSDGSDADVIDWAPGEPYIPFEEYSAKYASMSPADNYKLKIDNGTEGYHILCEDIGTNLSFSMCPGNVTVQPLPFNFTDDANTTVEDISTTADRLLPTFRQASTEITAKDNTQTPNTPVTTVMKTMIGTANVNTEKSKSGPTITTIQIPNEIVTSAMDSTTGTTNSYMQSPITQMITSKGGQSDSTNVNTQPTEVTEAKSEITKTSWPLPLKPMANATYISSDSTSTNTEPPASTMTTVRHDMVATTSANDPTGNTLLTSAAETLTGTTSGKIPTSGSVPEATSGSVSQPGGPVEEGGTTTPSDDTNKSTPKTVVIIGGVFGGIGAVATVSGVVYMVKKTTAFSKSVAPKDVEADKRTNQDVKPQKKAKQVKKKTK